MSGGPPRHHQRAVADGAPRRRSSGRRRRRCPSPGRSSAVLGHRAGPDDDRPDAVYDVSSRPRTSSDACAAMTVEPRRSARSRGLPPNASRVAASRTARPAGHARRGGGDATDPTADRGSDANRPEDPAGAPGGDGAPWGRFNRRNLVATHGVRSDTGFSTMSSDGSPRCPPVRPSVPSSARRIALRWGALGPTAQRRKAQPCISRRTTFRC